MRLLFERLVRDPDRRVGTRDAVLANLARITAYLRVEQAHDAPEVFAFGLPNPRNRDRDSPADREMYRLALVEQVRRYEPRLEITRAEMTDAGMPLDALKVVIHARLMGGPEDEEFRFEIFDDDGNQLTGA